MTTTTKIYVTKFLFAQGILVYENAIIVKGVAVVRYPNHDVKFIGEGKDWHRDLKSAQERSVRLLQNRFMMLRKQMLKVERLIDGPLVPRVMDTKKFPSEEIA